MLRRGGLFLYQRQFGIHSEITNIRAQGSRETECPEVSDWRHFRWTHKGLLSLVRALIQPYDAIVSVRESPLKALCVGRHQFLAEHFARFFGELGIETKAAVAAQGAPIESGDFEADVVICEYELLATLTMQSIEREPSLSLLPLVAVSLSRRPTEAQVLDSTGIGGFLYLPLLKPDVAMRVISAAAASARRRYVPAPATTSPAGALKN